MHLLADILLIDFLQKTSVSIRMPTLNFADPASVTTWLDLRRVVFDTGRRFTFRLNIIKNVFLCLTLSAILFCFFVAIKVIPS